MEGKITITLEPTVIHTLSQHILTKEDLLCVTQCWLLETQSWMVSDLKELAAWQKALCKAIQVKVYELWWQYIWVIACRIA